MDRLKCSLPTCPPGSTTTSYFECWVPHETTRGPLDALPATMSLLTIVDGEVVLEDPELAVAGQ